MKTGRLESWLRDPHRRPVVVGVLNVTPDSFSDGGRYLDANAAIGRGRQMLAEGADWLDIGGESTRPGSEPVDDAEQMSRVLPVIEALTGEGAVLSVDTTRSAVARAAVEAGAAVINDVTAGRDDPEMLEAMTHARAVVLMHMLGRPRTMQVSPSYSDVVVEVESHLLERAAAAERAGVARWRVLLDPGIGFGKTLRHNLLLLANLRRLAGHGYPLLVGTSRKRFIGKLTGEETPEKRMMGTAASVGWSIAHGAAAVRVHDVREMRQVLDTTWAILHPGEVEEDALGG